MDFLQALDLDGIATPGQIIHNRDISVNRQTPKETKMSVTHALTDW
jgi:DNA-directed RNA polymerase beta subunit